MKKNLLTFFSIAAFAATACAQGTPKTGTVSALKVDRSPSMARPKGGSALGDIKKDEQEKHEEWDKVSPEPKPSDKGNPKAAGETMFPGYNAGLHIYDNTPSYKNLGEQRNPTPKSISNESKKPNN